MTYHVWYERQLAFARLKNNPIVVCEVLFSSSQWHSVVENVNLGNREPVMEGVSQYYYSTFI